MKRWSGRVSWSFLRWQVRSTRECPLLPDASSSIVTKTRASERPHACACTAFEDSHDPVRAERKEHRGGRIPRHAVALGASRSPRHDGHEIRLRQDPLPRVHGPPRWRGDVLVPAAARVGREPQGHHNRRVAGPRGAGGPGSVGSHPGAAMRLLPARTGHGGSGTPLEDPQAKRRRDRRGDAVHPVPLRHLPADPHGHPRGRRAARGTVVSAPVNASRRTFLKVTAAAGGGLMLGLRLGAAEGAPPSAAFVPNAWISISSDESVKLVCARNEMGQGVRTSLAMLLAEELAVDPRHVAIEDAPPDPVYVNKLMGAQVTGGSTSIREAWDPMRQAGAPARTMLVAAPAGPWQVPAAECRAQDGHVLHGARKLSYGTLAADAARQNAPQSVPLKASAFTVIGSGLPRLDAADKTRGRTVFGIDVKQPGMLYAALAQCPVIGGHVRSFDASLPPKRAGRGQAGDLGEE